MDPLSHFVIGAGVAALSGEPFSWHNPIYLSAIIGAMAPDLDIVFQIKGDTTYLKNHRGFSHSLPGIVLGSLVFSILMKLAFANFSFLVLFKWSILGGLSHSLFDICNSYGAQLFGPWVNKKYSLNLIQIFDPIVLAVFGLLTWTSGGQGYIRVLLVGTLTSYLLLRWLMKRHLRRRVATYFAKQQILKLILFPSVLGLFSWDYILETKGKNYVGQVNLLRSEIKVKRKLIKEVPNEAISIALKSLIGELFREFTPHFHISYYTQGSKQIIKFFDLRYLLKKEFMHSATVVLEEEELIEAVFHPYHAKRNIYLSN